MEITRDQPIQLTLTAGDCSDILYALDELPRKTAQPIWEKINEAVIAKAQSLAQNNGSDEKDEVRRQEGNLQAEAQGNLHPAGEVKT